MRNSWRLTRSCVRWSAVDEHIERTPGKGNAVEAQIALDAFGKLFDKPTLTKVQFGMVEEYVKVCTAKGNKQATINKKLRYLRSAFNAAIRRGYLVKNPMSGW